MVALLAVGGLRLALPERLSVGPGWLLLVVVGVLLVPTIWARMGGAHGLNQVLGYVVVGMVTADMLWSVERLLTGVAGAYGVARGVVAVGCGALADEYSGICELVLAAGCRWAACAGDAGGACGGSVFVSADDAERAGEGRDGGGGVESGVCGLPVFWRSTRVRRFRRRMRRCFRGGRRG